MQVCERDKLRKMNNLAKLLWTTLWFSVAHCVTLTVYNLNPSNDELVQDVFINSKYSLSAFPGCELAERRAIPSPIPTLKVQRSNKTKAESIARLVQSGESVLQVYLSFSVVQIVAVSEKYEAVTLALRTEIIWTDCRVSWNPVDYSGTLFTSFSASKFRKLDMFVPEPRLLEEVDSKASLDSEKLVESTYTGSVRIVKEFTTTISCNFDVSMYPFDTQACQLTFEMQHNSLQVQLFNSHSNITDPGKLSKLLLGDGRFMPSDTWEIVVLPGVAKRIVMADSCTMLINSMRYCSFDRLTYTLILHRHPTYQLVNLMLPAILVVLISSCVFLIPYGSGDKMGLSLTILLSMFVFTQLMYEKLPETGSTIPLISQFYIVCIIFVSSSCIFSAIMTTVASSKQAVPRCLQKFAKCCAPFLLCRSLQIENVRGQHPKRKGKQYDAIDSGQLAELAAATEEEEGDDAITWCQFAPLVDRVFFVLHCLSCIVLFLTFILYGYYPWKTSYGGKLPEEHTASA